MFFHERVEQSRKNEPFGRFGVFELNAQLFRLGARVLIRLPRVIVRAAVLLDGFRHGHALPGRLHVYFRSLIHDFRASAHVARDGAVKILYKLHHVHIVGASYISTVVNSGLCVESMPSLRNILPTSYTLSKPPTIRRLR